MALQFILGGSGSGKTRSLYEALIRESVERPEGRYLAIVPEQSTMQAQKEIATLHPRHGVMNIDIVSFERLAYRVFEELAIVNPDVLDDMGKSMVLRKVAAKVRPRLALYRNQLDKNGFIGQMKSMLSELYQYGITPEILADEIPRAGNVVLEQKLRDISVIYQEFQDYIKGKFITTEEILDVLCKNLERSEIVKGSVITLDGYTGFTPVQYRVLELFLRLAKRVTVTVTMDPRYPVNRTCGVYELFYMSRQMMNRLTELAGSHGVAREEDRFLTDHPAVRFQESPDGGYIDFLEQNLYRYQGRSCEGSPRAVRLCQCLSPSDEVACVIRRMEEAIRREGLCYRDMAVITGDPAGYSKIIAHQFEQEKIPYFLDDKKTILENPMVEFIRAALGVLEHDFSYESVFRYIRCGLVVEPGEEKAADRLENYVIAMGIRGLKRWNSRWEGFYRRGKELNLEELNAYREKILDPLARLREEFRREGCVARDMAKAVVELLSECGIEEKMAAWEAAFTEAGQYGLAKEYGQVYGLVLDLFDRLAALLGDEKISRKEFGEILDAGFSEMKVGIIPAAVDRVVVGDITRTRLDHIKILFFVGVNDGIVPVKKENSSLFTDREREYLGCHAIELAPTAKEEGFRQRFYLYLALTKPERRLYLTWAVMDTSGKSLRPSTLVNEMKRLFPGLNVECFGSDWAGDQLPYTVREAKEELIFGLRRLGAQRKEARFYELLRSFLASDEYQQEAKRLVEAAFFTYERQGIGRIAARALYGSVLSGSVTRLEQYASCAYAHFLSYGLELSERQEYELAAMDIGNLFHDSIDLYFNRMKEENRDWKGMEEEERKALVHECVNQVTEEYGNTILKSSARNQYLARKVERITDRTVWALTEQLKKGDFTPAGFEVSFSAADGLKAMKIPLGQGEFLHLKGRIDRLDLCEDEDCVYVKIIDYKSGSTEFDLTALYYGLQLQLVVYMDAALEMEERRHPDKKVIPAGIFYYNINDPVLEREEGMKQADLDKRILKQLRMNGLVNSKLEVISHLDREIETESDVIPVAMRDGLIQEAKSSVAGERRFAALKRYVGEKLRCEGREILEGRTDVNPYKQGNRTACDYCPYHAVCGFDLKISGYGYRKFKALKSEDIWPEIEGEEGEDGHGDEVDGETVDGD